MEPNLNQPLPQQPNRKPIVVSVAVVAVCSIAVLMYFFYSRQNANEETVTSDQATLKTESDSGVQINSNKQNNMEEKKVIGEALVNFKKVLESKDLKAVEQLLRKAAAADPDSELDEEFFTQMAADPESAMEIIEATKDKYAPFTEALLSSPDAKWQIADNKASFETEVQNPDIVKNGTTFKGGTSILRFKAVKGGDGVWYITPELI